MATKKTNSDENENVVVEKKRYFMPTEDRKSVEADTAEEAVQKLKSENENDEGNK